MRQFQTKCHNFLTFIARRVLVSRQTETPEVRCDLTHRQTDMHTDMASTITLTAHAWQGLITIGIYRLEFSSTVTIYTSTYNSSILEQYNYNSYIEQEKYPAFVFLSVLRLNRMYCVAYTCPKVIPKVKSAELHNTIVDWCVSFNF